MGRSKKSRGKADAPVSEAQRRRRFSFAAAALGLVLLVGIGTAGWLLLIGGGGSASGTKSAIIVDQLSLSQPNPDFISSARRLLGEAGYSVEYIQGERVTVDFYRTLPQRGNDLVILRVHAGITTEVDVSSGERTETEYVSLFTGEAYSRGKYADEELNRVGRATYSEGADPLFGIGPEFVRRSMEGTFDDAVIVMMGCDGLRSRTTAEAFLEKGASDFVSWSQPVSASHTDAATERLLENLLLAGLSTPEAVSRTAEEVGPDPTYGGELRVISNGG